MKKIILIAILFAVSSTSYSQSLGYQDLGVLFSQNDEIISTQNFDSAWNYMAICYKG